MQTDDANAMSVDCSRTLFPSSSSSTVPPHQLPSPDVSLSSSTKLLDVIKSSGSSLLNRMRDKHEKENISLELLQTPTSIAVTRSPNPSPNRLNQSITTKQQISITSGPSFTLKSQLVMSLCDVLISYDLNELEDDPKVIIDLLKATDSERDKWIMVGCHYRRKGNTGAALAVITTMIEGKTSTYAY